MQLREAPVGATVKLAPSAISLLEEEAKKKDRQWLMYDQPNPYSMAGKEDNLYQIVGPHLEEPYSAPSIAYVDTSARGRHIPWPSRNAAWAGYEVEVVNLLPPDMTKGDLPQRGLFSTSADPELFFEDGDGNLLPGFNLFPPKKQPLKSRGGLFHEDGFQGEFSPTPRQCHEQVVCNIYDTLHDMLRVAKLNCPTAKISWKNFVEIPQALMDAATPEQASLGCDPSENVYGTSPFVVDNPKSFPYRMAGGHIHLGDPKITKWLHSRAEPIIKSMDAFAGVASVALFAGIEDPRRREYYGRAGEFRFQPHGLEYRTLSNAWVLHPAVAHLMLNLARGAFRLGFMEWREVLKFDEQRVQGIINTFDVEDARAFIAENGKMFTHLLNADSGYSWGTKAMKLIVFGMRDIIPDWQDPYQAWVTAGAVSFQSYKSTFVMPRARAK